MELSVLPSGISALYQMLREFELSQGEQLLKDLEKNPKVYLELLRDRGEKLKKNFVYKNTSLKEEWSPKNFVTYFEAIKPTPFQRSILRILTEYPKGISLDQLKEKIEKNSKLVISNGSQIGGCISGITKKCESIGVPNLLTIQNFGIGIYKYSLNFDSNLKECLRNYLQEADALDKQMLKPIKRKKVSKKKN